MGILDRDEPGFSISNDPINELTQEQCRLLANDLVIPRQGATLVPFEFEGKMYVKWVPDDWIKKELSK